MGKITFSKQKIFLLIFIISIGSFLYSLAVNIFISPNNIAPGGLTGVAIVLNHLFSLPLGIMILTMNIPLFLLSVRYFGLNFLFKTVFATFASSLFIDVFSPFLPVFEGDGLVASLYGGVISGTGLSLVFLRGGTTGGTDIASRIIKRYIPSASLGRIILILDAIIIVFLPSHSKVLTVLFMQLLRFFAVPQLLIEYYMAIQVVK